MKVGGWATRVCCWAVRGEREPWVAVGGPECLRLSWGARWAVGETAEGLS